MLVTAKSIVSSFTAVAVCLNINFMDCDASCQADFSDVKKVVKDVLRPKKRDEFEEETIKFDF